VIASSRSRRPGLPRGGRHVDCRAVRAEAPAGRVSTVTNRGEDRVEMKDAVREEDEPDHSTECRQSEPT